MRHYNNKCIHVDVVCTKLLGGNLAQANHYAFAGGVHCTGCVGVSLAGNGSNVNGPATAAWHLAGAGVFPSAGVEAVVISGALAANAIYQGV